MKHKLHDFITAFPDRCVLIVGDVMLDEYIWGRVQRISPEAPVPVVEVERRTYVAGGAGNTAANVAALGGRVLLGGAVGRDEQADRLCEALAAAGVDGGGLMTDEQRPTTTKSRIVAHNQQVARIDAERREGLTRDLEDALLGWFEEVLPAADACVLSDYAKGVVSPRLAERCIRLAREAGRPVVVDPKGTDFLKYRGATVITPNLLEAERALNRTVDGEQGLRSVADGLLEMLAGSALLLTRGAEGVSLFVPDAPVLHIPAAARNVFDVTGAGDTVVSVLALALAAGASLEAAARLANRAAGLVVGKVGTATIRREELFEQIRESTSPVLD